MFTKISRRSTKRGRRNGKPFISNAFFDRICSILICGTQSVLKWTQAQATKPNVDSEEREIGNKAKCVFYVKEQRPNLHSGLIAHGLSLDLPSYLAYSKLTHASGTEIRFPFLCSNDKCRQLWSVVFRHLNNNNDLQCTRFNILTKVTFHSISAIFHCHNVSLYGAKGVSIAYCIWQILWFFVPYNVTLWLVPHYCWQCA